MAKAKFPKDVANLAVFSNAKRVIESFLETECSVTVEMSPVKARRLRKQILKDVKFAIEQVQLANPKKILVRVGTDKLAQALFDLVREQYIMDWGGESVDRIWILAHLIYSIRRR